MCSDTKKTDKITSTQCKNGDWPVHWLVQAAADLAPGTGQQNGKTGVNPIAKAFATPTRGLGDKEGENEARAGNLLAKKDDLPGNDQTYRQNTGISEGIYNAFKSAGEGRDAGVGTKPQ